MKKEQIAEILEEKHQNLFDWLENQPKNLWEKGSEKKWTTGQHTLHLADSLALLNKALKYPKFLLKYKFGICNRATRDYETIVKKYHEKLAVNQERATNFNKDLKIPLLSEKEILINKLNTGSKKLQKKLKILKDKDLDRLLLPHPLMGRMTLREIIMWTAHHTEHHTKTLTENY